MIKKLTALLIIMAMTVMVLPVIASASASETALLANFDIDSLELENGGDIYSQTNSNGSATGLRAYYTYNGSSYFLQLYRSNSADVSFTAHEEQDFSGQAAKISFAETTSSVKSATLRFLVNTVTANKNQTAARTSNIAYSFDLKIPSGLSLKLSAQGQSSTAETVSQKTADYLTSTLCDIAATGTTVKTYSYTKDTTASPNITNNTDTQFKRNEYVNFKIIFNYENGTFDLYINNYLVTSGNGLAGTKFLSDFLIYIGQPKNTGEIDAFIDNLSYRVITENDLSQVYLADPTANGTLTLNEKFTEVGKPITFTATPDAGCKLTSLTLDGKEISGLTISPAGGTYTIDSLPYGGELKAVFEEKRVTTKIADFDIDSLNLESGASIAYNTYYDFNDDPNFLQLTKNGNGSFAVDGTDNQVLKIFGEKGAYSAATVTFLRNDLNTNRTTKQKELRTNDIALSFDVKLLTGTVLEVSAMGLPSNATISKNASGFWLTDPITDPDSGESSTPSFLTSTILSCGRSGTGGYTNSYTKDTTVDPEKKYVDEIVTRDEYVNYKIIFDYEQGTYDVYKNGELIAENNRLAGAQYLSDFKISLHHQSGHSGEYDIEAYLDNIRLYSIAEEDIKIQPNVAKSGNGTVSADKDIVSEGDNVSYTITPADGGYLRNVSLDGNPIPAFSSSGITYTIPSVTSRRNLSVSFGNYTDGSPVVMISPLAVVQNDTTYLFCKLLLNNTSVSEYGILLSRTSEIPALNDSETKKMPFFGNKDANGYPLNANGYFGFALINTSEESSSFYARPYAKIGDDYVFGVVEYIEPDNLESL